MSAVLCLGALPALGQGNPGDPRNFDASQFGERVTLGPEWLFHAGDDPAWAAPGLDDSGWQTVSAEKQLFEYGIHDIHYGWYRIHVRLPERARNLSVGVSSVSGKYEVYANGFPGQRFSFNGGCWISLFLKKWPPVTECWFWRCGFDSIRLAIGVRGARLRLTAGRACISMAETRRAGMPPMSRVIWPGTG